MLGRVQSALPKELHAKPIPESVGIWQLTQAYEAVR